MASPYIPDPVKCPLVPEDPTPRCQATWSNPPTPAHRRDDTGNCLVYDADCRCQACKPATRLNTYSEADVRSGPEVCLRDYFKPYETPCPEDRKKNYCATCSGPEFLCEKLFDIQECPDDKPFCINQITNRKDGTRSVVRGCGTTDTCYKEWFLGSSDIDKCRNWDDQFRTLDFDCTFCCYPHDPNPQHGGAPYDGDPNKGCNEPLRPDSGSLYKNL